MLDHPKDIKKRFALRNIENGTFISWSSDNMPLTPKISQARRFLNGEEVYFFLHESPYKPDDPQNYEIVEMKITYELEGVHQ